MDEDFSAMADGDGVSVHSGFPNPALERRGQGARLALDINQLLIKRPSSTYLFNIEGHQWSDQGIYDGDIAVIDRAIEPRPADLVIAWRTSGSTLCRRGQLTHNDEVWGVVTAIIHQYD
ncbi:MAG TPA: S24 family peptidase [Candidatus Saccharimonadales bacterium]